METKINDFLEQLDFLGFSVERKNFACENNDEISIQNINELMEPLCTAEWLLIFSAAIKNGLNVTIKDVDIFNDLIIIKVK
jgi:hypothetical protein